MRNDELVVRAPLKFHVPGTPTIVGVLLTILLAILIIVPKYTRMFTDFELGDLPFMTKVLLACSNTASEYWFLAPGVLFWGVWMTSRLESDPHRSHRVKVLIAVLCALVVFFAVAMFFSLIMIMEKIGT